ncbi:hypothetical protein [Rhodopirellula bahusiensis]|uniref:Uncharacterized protein n=1 Tax=Rhodopirellula bahusiensis TaxID=2014065 RepID=A0A2G1W667_9BACT|nr:hypothetical protein [Rhodopirellula bahusiensis]PHQ34518.1 hypothetical protein CEE69_15760 [Rhodopirellula bahusiensis]
MDAILNTVVYDTSVPVIPASYRDPGEYSQSPAADTPAADAKPVATKTFTDRARSAGAFVGHGLRATVGLVLVGTFKIVETSLGLNDSTPRGRNDTAFNQWLDDRDRWRRED